MRRISGRTPEIASAKNKRQKIHKDKSELARPPSNTVIEELRKEFETLRMQKIKAVAHKHKDAPLYFDDCYRHLMDEVRELDSIVFSATNDLLPLERNLIIKELIDVVNCAEFTFIALKLKGLRLKT